MELLVTMVEKVCVIVLLGYVVSRAPFFRAYLTGGRPRARDLLAMVATFGLFSVYGTLGGTRIGEAVINVRDAGPMIAGLVGGPLPGLLAGLAGGLHRLWLGLGDMGEWQRLGYTCIPCSLSTVLVGLLAGLVRRRWGVLRIHWAVVFALLGESIHMLLGLLLAGDPARWLEAASIIQAWDLVISRATAPMVLANGLGVGIFFFALQNYRNELRTAQERDEFYRQVERRNVELQTVYQISQDITSSLELDQTLQTVLERVRQIVSYDGAEICLYDEAEHLLRVRAWAGSDNVPADTRGRVYRLGEGYTGWIGERRRSLLVPDVEAERAQRPVADEVLLKSFLGAPLMVGSKMVGTLELISAQPEAFDEHARQLLETVAPQAAIAIQNAEQVLERERLLKQQIEQLRIKVDEAKRARQVAQITETEYFRGLQERARKMRRMSASSSPEQETD
jgi:LytS/YehU family sensor histidine kinase